MTIVKESPIIQELYQLAFDEGEQKGRLEGLRQATLQGLHQILMIRFDALPPELERRLEALDLPALQQLTTAALTLPTLPEFEQKLAVF